MAGLAFLITEDSFVPDYLQDTEGEDAILAESFRKDRYAALYDLAFLCHGAVSPSLSFSKVDAGILREYKRYSNAPCGITNGRVTGEFRSAFNGIDSDDKYVYVLYSGNRMRGGTLPSNECRHLIVYDWDGNPVKRYILNRNVCSVHIDSGTLWCASTYPESCVYRFDMPKP